MERREPGQRRDGEREPREESVEQPPAAVDEVLHLARVVVGPLLGLVGADARLAAQSATCLGREVGPRQPRRRDGDDPEGQEDGVTVTTAQPSARPTA